MGLFTVHKLTESGTAKANAIARDFEVLLMQLEELCDTQSREFSLVKTKLEEACFYAKKSMAMEPHNHG